MTADEALNKYLKAYDIDATYMSHAEKIGKIYGKGFESGLQIAINRMLESIEKKSKHPLFSHYDTGYLKACEEFRQEVEELKEGHK